MHETVPSLLLGQCGDKRRHLEWHILSLRPDVALFGAKTFFDGMCGGLRLMGMARLEKPARPEVKTE